MSAPCWKEQIARLAETAARNKRLALVGIGSELKGDDAAGVATIRLLRPLFADRENVLLLEAGPVPENFTGPLRRYQPGLILLMDAGGFGGEPGEVHVLDWREAQGFSASTHTLPLNVFAGYLEEEIGCPVVLLAIQPQQTEFGQPLSPPVEAAVREIAQEIGSLLA